MNPLTISLCASLWTLLCVWFGFGLGFKVGKERDEGRGSAARAYSVQRVPFWSDFVKANAAAFAAVTSKRAVQWGLIVAGVLGALFLLAQLRRGHREAEA